MLPTFVIPPLAAINSLKAWFIASGLPLCGSLCDDCNKLSPSFPDMVSEGERAWYNKSTSARYTLAEVGKASLANGLSFVFGASLETDKETGEQSN